MSKIYVSLNGGLGNQMFQYAAGRALANRTNSELVLDSWSGFIRDYEYKRTYQLNLLPIRARLASPLERLGIWLYRIEKKLLKFSNEEFISRLYGEYLCEQNLYYQESFLEFKGKRNTWLIGYWQSPIYFEEVKELIAKELMPNPPLEEIFLETSKEMLELNSVAIGVRLYEESSNPLAHSRESTIKPIEQMNDAIKKVLTDMPEARLYIFCTHMSSLLKELALPANTVYVTHDNGFNGALNRLWLLSQCRHHIFNNSSFYWWGAWLSQEKYKKVNIKQKIFMADNFINRDGISKGWKYF